MKSQGCLKLQLTMDCQGAEQMIWTFKLWILFGSTIPWTANYFLMFLKVDLWPWGEASQGCFHHLPRGRSSFFPAGGASLSAPWRSPSRSDSLFPKQKGCHSKASRSKAWHNFLCRPLIQSVLQPFLLTKFFSARRQFLHNFDASFRPCKIFPSGPVRFFHQTL